MPSHDDRLLQRILDALAAEDAEFKAVRFLAEPGGQFPFTPDPPLLHGGSRAQRLAALTEWRAEWNARPAVERTALPPDVIKRAARAIEELNVLAQTGESDDEEASR